MIKTIRFSKNEFGILCFGTQDRNNVFIILACISLDILCSSNRISRTARPSNASAVDCAARGIHIMLSRSLTSETSAMSLGMSTMDFFNRFCDVVVTPGGFRYSVILAPNGCPFLKDKLCGIHFFKPIGCWVFPESSLLPVTLTEEAC